MPRLQEFVGNREYPHKPPAAASPSAMHPTSKNERMRAIIQGLALSTDPQKLTSVYGSQDSSFSGRQLKTDENNNASPLPVAQLATPGSSTINTRWHGNRPVARASFPTKDSPWRHPNPMEGADLSNDIFGTDIENFDSTMASSDIGSSDLGDGGIGKAFPINLHQSYKLEHIQQGSAALTKVYNGPRNDESLVLLDTEAALGDRGKYQSSDEETTDSHSADDKDRIPGVLNPIGVGLNMDHGGYPGTRSPGLVPVRAKSTPDLAMMQKTVTIKNPTGGSTSAISTGVKNISDGIFRTPSGESGHQSSRPIESRKLGLESSNNNGQIDEERRPNTAEVNHVGSSLKDGAISTDVALRFLEGGSSFPSRSANLKRTAELGDSSTSRGRISFRQTKGEPFKQCLEPGTTVRLQSADRELSNNLMKLYHLKGSCDALSQREAFFSALNATQSERCGEYFMEKFVDIVGKYNAVRRQRRNIAIALEAEVASRESQVVIRKEVVDRNLDELRQAGKVVVRRKNFNPGL